MNIRKADLNSLNDICEMYQELFAHIAVLQPAFYKISDASREFLKNIIESEKSDIFIAVIVLLKRYGFVTNI